VFGTHLTVAGSVGQLRQGRFLYWADRRQLGLQEALGLSLKSLAGGSSILFEKENGRQGQQETAKTSCGPVFPTA